MHLSVLLMRDRVSHFFEINGTDYTDITYSICHQLNTSSIATQLRSVVRRPISVHAAIHATNYCKRLAKQSHISSDRLCRYSSAGTSKQRPDHDLVKLLNCNSGRDYNCAKSHLALSTSIHLANHGKRSHWLTANDST